MVWHDTFPLGPMKAGLWPVRNIVNMVSAPAKGDGQARDTQVREARPRPAPLFTCSFARRLVGLGLTACICPAPQGEFSGGRLRPTHNQLSDYIAVQFSSLPKIAITILCWQYTVDFEAASHGYDWAMDGWVMKVILRDLFLMVAIAVSCEYTPGLP